MSRIDADAFDALPSDARDALRAARRAEGDNFGRTGAGKPLWMIALLTNSGSSSEDSARATRRCELMDHLVDLGGEFAPSRRTVPPVYDGDPLPAEIVERLSDLTQQTRNDFDPAGAALESRRLRCELATGGEYHEPFSVAVRKTHRVVHEALAGEPTLWCEWCRTVDNNKNP